MLRASSGLLATFLAVGICVSGVSCAKAAQVISLEDVALEDGGTVTGQFSLNIDSYLAGFDITATDPALGVMIFSTGNPSSIAPSTPPANTFTFNSPSYNFALVLSVVSPIGYTSGGILELIPGSSMIVNNETVFAGSYEICGFNCAPIDNGTVEFITSGRLEVPEPGSLALLVSSIFLLPAARRRWSRHAPGALRGDAFAAPSLTV